MDWSLIINSILGCTTLLGFVLFFKENKRVKNAEAKEAEARADAATNAGWNERMSQLHTHITLCNETNERQMEIIKKHEITIDDKTDRIRKLTDDLYESQKEVNLVNDKLNDAYRRNIKLTEERDRERLEKERYKAWLCQKSECDDREPSNPNLKGQVFDPKALPVCAYSKPCKNKKNHKETICLDVNNK